VHVVDPSDELVVLCDRSGAAIGTEPKATVHHANTPLHLAFSCYVFDRHGWLLVSRRAASKRTWPAVRTNSCCGHPLPGESMTAAITRRLRDELGVTVAELDLMLPGFGYRASMANGVVENELCPVYRAIADSRTVTPAPDEVAEAWWQPWADFAGADQPDDPRSPWSDQQVAALAELGRDPLRWPVADPSLLPAAAVA
jgi:isopentenyl-diphosphate delta-isomerase